LWDFPQGGKMYEDEEEKPAFEKQDESYLDEFLDDLD